VIISDQVANLFHFRRNRLSTNHYRAARALAFSAWAEIADRVTRCMTQADALVRFLTPSRSLT
jgi:hypothetical protein